MKELYQKRMRLINQMKDVQLRSAEDGSLAAEDQATWDRIDGEVQVITRQINRENALKGYEGFENNGADAPTGEGGEEERSLNDRVLDLEEKITEANYVERQLGDKAQKAVKQHRDAFKNYIKRGFSKLTSDEQKIVGAAYERGTGAQGIAPDNLGGYLVPEEWASEMIEAMAYYGGMFTAPRQVSRSTGRKLHVPKTLHAGGGASAIQKGAIITEHTADTVTDITFGETIIDFFTFTSGLILASYELLQDDDFNVEGLIGSIASDRVGRIVNEKFTIGVGTTEPLGIVPAAVINLTGLTNSGITYPEWVDLEHKVDPAYRSKSNPKCGYMFNDTTLASIKKLQIGSGDSQPLWTPSMREGEPDRILGYRYWINNDMASIATTTIPALFGNFDHYWAARAKGMSLTRLTERYAEKRQVGYFVYARFGGGLVDLNAIAKLTMAV